MPPQPRMYRDVYYVKNVFSKKATNVKTLSYLMLNALIKNLLFYMRCIADRRYIYFVEKFARTFPPFLYSPKKGKNIKRVAGHEPYIYIDSVEVTAKIWLEVEAEQRKNYQEKLRVSFSLSARHLSVRVCISNVVLRRLSRCVLRTAQW